MKQLNYNILQFMKLVQNINTNATIYLFKVYYGKHHSNVWNLRDVKNKDMVSMIWSEWRHWRRSGVFVVNFEQVSRIILVFPLLTLNK